MLNVNAPWEIQVYLQQKSGRIENCKIDFTGLVENYVMSEEQFQNS